MICKVYIELIKNEELKEKFINLFNYVEKKYDFSKKPAAKRHHHAYVTGLDVHTSEVCQNILDLNKDYVKEPFDEDKLISVALLHDLSKVYTYRLPDKDGIIKIISFPCSPESMIFRLCTKFGIVLSFEEISAIEHHHGGWSIQASDKFQQPSNIAYLLMCADLLSANFGSIKD